MALFFSKLPPQHGWELAGLKRNKARLFDLQRSSKTNYGYQCGTAWIKRMIHV